MELTKEVILSTAKSYASAWNTKEEMDVARVSFIHAVDWVLKHMNQKPLLGKELKMRRIGLGLKLRQVENETGISNSYLSQLENEKITNPSFDIVTKINIYYASK